MSCKLKKLEQKYEKLGKKIEQIKNVKTFDPHDDKLFLLSKEEYSIVKKNIKKYCSFLGNVTIWLRSSNLLSLSSTWVVSLDGHLNSRRNTDYNYGVVPAFIKKTNKSIGTRKTKYNFPFVYVGNDIWVSELPIFWSRFGEESNDYESSEIRQKILQWAKERE